MERWRRVCGTDAQLLRLLFPAVGVGWGWSELCLLILGRGGHGKP